jgi:hypothetical protein
VEGFDVDCLNPACGCDFCPDEEFPEEDCPNVECGCGFCDEDEEEECSITPKDLPCAGILRHVQGVAAA